MNICRIATVPFFLQHHLLSQIVATTEAGHKVTLISSDGEDVEKLKEIKNISFKLINIPRVISPWRDFLALWKLYNYFRENNFDIIHSVTPKAGLLCAIAGFAARVPIRLHTFTGQPWVELSGLMRNLAKTSDWVISHLNTMVYADSFSQRDFLMEQGVAKKQKIAVIGSGSLAGVDVNRFEKQKWLSQSVSLRREMGISKHALVVTFIGRLTKDKGVSELVEAFSRLREHKAGVVLLLIGPQEPERDPLPAETLVLMRQNDSIFEVGYTSEPEKYLAISDILCLPSYREGFGNVVIEAAAMGVPTVATDIVGLRDAVVDNLTGKLVRVKSVSALTLGLMELLTHADSRIGMGEAAKDRARREFSSNIVNSGVLAEYESLARLHCSCKQDG